MVIPVLPAELLCRVFSFLLDPSSKGSSYHEQYAFSQVCQSWRTIALADPSLWRVLKSHTPRRWIPELIQRSRGSNLNVDLKGPIHPNMLQAITTHFSGIRTLRLNLDVQSVAPSILHEGVQATSAQDLPLRVLEVAARSRGTAEQESPTPLDQDLAAIIARSSQLQELSLSGGVNLLWNAPLPSSLTTLELGGVRRPSLNTFLDTLRQMPQLQILFLGHCGPQDGIEPLLPVSAHKVDLPCLVSAILAPIHLSTESFFRYLNFSYKRVDLLFTGGPTHSTSLPAMYYIFDRFHHPDHRFKWPAPRHLKVNINAVSIRLELLLSPQSTQATTFEDWKDTCQLLEVTRNVTLTFHWTSDPEVPQAQAGIPRALRNSFFHHLSHCLPLRFVEALELHGEEFNSLTSEDFADLLGNLSEVVYLNASVYNVSLWKALEERQRWGQQRAGGFLPKLRHVSVDMDPYGYGDVVDEQRDAGLDWVKKWVTVRAVSDGLKLVRLEFAYTEWAGYRGHISGFEQLVGLPLSTNHSYGRPPNA